MSDPNELITPKHLRLYVARHRARGELDVVQAWAFHGAPHGTAVFTFGSEQEDDLGDWELLRELDLEALAKGPDDLDQMIDQLTAK